MIGQGVTLGLGGDAFKGVFCATVRMIFSKHVMSMIVDDWEGLDDLLEVLDSSIFEVAHVVEARVEIWLGRHRSWVVSGPDDTEYHTQQRDWKMLTQCQAWHGR